jgi:hypothetical protein
MRLCQHGADVVVVTARVARPDAVVAELEACGVASLVRSVVTRASLPDHIRQRDTTDDKTELFDIACALVGSEPGNAHYVTDWPLDVKAALRFGFQSTSGVLTGGYRRVHFPENVVVDADVLTAVRSSSDG